MADLIPAGSEAEWLDARRQGVTASEIAVIMGLSPYSSPYALYHQKLGNLPGLEDNLVLRVGRHNESLACDLFAERHPEFYVEGDGRQLYAHPERRWQMATLDRLLHECQCGPGEAMWPHACLADPLAVLEAKTAVSYDGWGDDGTDEIPVHYRCQVLWQMDVMGVDTAFVACLFLHTRQLRVYEIEMDMSAAGDLALMRHHAGQFMKRLDAGDEPDVDWRPATADALKRLHPGLEDTEITISRTLAGQYRGACTAVKKAEQRKALAENRIRARLGSGRRVLDPSGQPVATRQVYEVKEHVRKAATVNKLVPARAKKETSE